MLFEKIDCVRIPVKSLEEGLKFYHEKLGHEIIWRTKKAIGLKLKDDKSELIIHTESLPLEIDFKVKSVEEAKNSFLEAGGTLVKEPFDIDIGKCVVVRDPWDNEYVLVDSSKGLYQVNENKEVVDVEQSYFWEE